VAVKITFPGMRDDADDPEQEAGSRVVRIVDAELTAHDFSGAEKRARGLHVDHCRWSSRGGIPRSKRLPG